jgi:phage terminase large subunit-like protein
VKAGPKGEVFATPLYLDDLPASGGKRVLRFSSKYLSVPKGTGAGQPFRLQRWQQEIVTALYDDPRPRQGLLLLPRGNGKSTLAAVLALYSLFADGVEAPQVLIVASDLRQAGIVFDAARRMVELSPPLADRTLVYSDRLVVPGNSGTLTALPAEVAALQGWDPSLLIVDELSVVRDDTWEAATSAAGKRDKSLTLAISTPPPDGNRDGVLWRLVQSGRERSDPSFFFREYTAPESCDLQDLTAWKQANPALGSFLHEDGMRALLMSMRESSFRRLRLGQWVQDESNWIDWDDWMVCALPDVQVDPLDPVVLFFDGSASGDSTGIVGCAVTAPHHLFTVAVWENPGDLRWRVDRADVDAKVDDCFRTLNVVELACDPWGWRSEIEAWAGRYGASRVLEMPTNVISRMAPATDRMYQAIKARTVTHDGNDRLAAHVAHAVAKPTTLGDVIVKERKNSPRKIDLAVCAIGALDRASWHHNNRPHRKRWAVSTR